MPYDLMKETQQLVDDNYRQGLISRDVWFDAISSLHDAYSLSNDIPRCVCYCCRKGF